MDDKAVRSSYGLVRDSKRDSWILTCPLERWHAIRPPAVSSERRLEGRSVCETERSASVIAPLVVLVLTVASALLLHALR